MIADSLAAVGSVTAVLNIADLTAGDNSADYRRLPVIIGSNQCSGSVEKFQPRIGSMH